MMDNTRHADALARLVTDLQSIFGERLTSLSTYDGAGGADALTGEAATTAGGHVHTLAVVESLGRHDLFGCAGFAKSWAKRGLATPLFMTRAELERSLDSFPLELGEMIARHGVVFGADPFTGLAVQADDLRLACEVQARSLLLHLREAYVEAAAQPKQVAKIIQASVRPLRVLLAAMARLEGIDPEEPDAMTRHVSDNIGMGISVVRQVIASGGPSGLSAVDAQDLFPAYTDAVERLVQHVDGWRS